MLTKNDAVVAVIKETMEYDKFAFHDLNRDTSDNQQRVLTKSISIKDYADDTPILVKIYKGKLIILDGQHRYKTRKALGLPIYYKVANHVDIPDVPNLNGTNKKWDLSDYVMSYSKHGNDNYTKLIQFTEKYSPLAIRSAIRIMGYHDRGSQINSDNSILNNANVKSGLFVYPTTTTHIVDAECITELVPFFGRGYNRELISAYMSHLKPTPDYNQNTMVRALETELNNKGTEYLTMPNTTLGVATLLNRLYVKYSRGKNRIMFNGVSVM